MHMWNDSVDEYLLKFPDGRAVGVGQLGEWLEAIRDDPETTDDEIILAEAIVQSIRAKLSLCGTLGACPDRGA